MSATWNSLSTLQWMILLIILVGFFTTHTVKAQNRCISKITCSECIQTIGCAWCMQPDNGDRPRCQQPEFSNECPEKFLYDPINEEKIITNNKLTRSNSTANVDISKSTVKDDIVQISPQRVNLKLRINQAHSLHMNYAQVLAYPIDLYYLMDLSKSMEVHKKKLSDLGSQLATDMREITSNFRLGFGSFGDKVVMPYTSTLPNQLLEPCEGCVAPYSYQHHMSLCTDDIKFANEVAKAKVSGNLDSPEGGFDAIMQAIVCRQQVGWRDQARRLLVFGTDAGFHYACDGKLGGIILPNDGKCHLDANGRYTHAETLDYPSIAHIDQKVRENAINIMFVVTKGQQIVYKELSKHIEGSITAVLSDDSSNVVELIREEYKKISSSIELKDNATDHVKISYKSACLTGGPEKPTAQCDNLKVGDLISFTIEVEVISCPTDPRDWSQVIQIYPVGINESLIIDLEMLCRCPCESEGSEFFQLNSDKCSGEGTYMCGICECDALHFGSHCECSSANLNVVDKDNGWSNCRPNNKTTQDCNGLGTCICGRCDCKKLKNPDQIISGKYCECDNFSCERNKNGLCSGMANGICECGKCICKPGWSGSSCSCSTVNDTCIRPDIGGDGGTGEICSGHGECICGACNCQSTEDGVYLGTYCERCPTCFNRCSELKDCVQCQMYKTGPLRNANDCSKNCNSFTTLSVDQITIDEDKEEEKCMFYDENECKFTFKYDTKMDKQFKVTAQRKLECSEKIAMLTILSFIAGAIIFIGFTILLVWKLATTLYDRREFARFEKERMNAKWVTGANPIYREVTTTFRNPTYSRHSRVGNKNK